MKKCSKILTVLVLALILIGCGSNNTFNSEPEAVLRTMEFPLTGDVNGDGKVNIADVTDLIDNLLTNNTDKKGDVNGDGSVNIEDVTALIDLLLTSGTQYDDGNYIVNGVYFKMIKVDGGTFTMGSPPTELGSSTTERPQHQVTLSDYQIGETEVTQELWVAVMGNNPSIFKGDLQRPVEYVNWDNCQEFINKLNEITGLNFHLPSEAQWEFAARGGNLSHGYKFSGSSKVIEVAWYKTNSDSITHPVKQLMPNELGIYDMSGNVCEWCNDWYYAYTSAAQVDPTGPETGSWKVYRWGSWNDAAAQCRVAYRYCREKSYRTHFLGFRLAL